MSLRSAFTTTFNRIGRWPGAAGVDNHMNRTLNDQDDDLQLPQRGSSRDMSRDTDRRSPVRDDRYEGEHGADREMTLSTGTVLGIFFALAIICAVFFGFGYSMGRKSGLATAESASSSSVTGTDALNAGASTADAPGSKPSAGSAAIPAIPGYVGQHESETASRPITTPGPKPGRPVASTGTTSVTVPLTGGLPESKPGTPESPAAAQARKPSPDIAAVAKPLPATSKPAATASITPIPAAVGAGVASGPIYVQVAAVSHKEDADNLLAALKRRGYGAFERNLESDKLIHIQVGPFNSKQSAEAMRTRLQGDSYNAILK